MITYIRKYLFNRHFKHIRRFIRYGNSIFLGSFKLNINFPDNKKLYLTVGDDCMLDCSIIFETVTGEVTIGNKTFIGPSNIICNNKVEIGSNVFIAWGCWLYDHDSHSIDYRERQKDIQTQLNDFRSGRNFIENKNWEVVNSKPIKISDNVWIGMNCHILKGVSIGEGAIVGAGSVVTNDVLPWTIVGGNPARVLKKLPEELQRK